MKHLSNISMNKVFEPRIPLMSPAKFASEVGVSQSTLSGWMDRGLLPFVTLDQSGEGKRPKRFINIKKLFEFCSEGGA
jgi:hypothetical protein